ncbi:hypothetical protein [Christiangramia portivictoriae]|uniref:hypothetical protein n=1 Tax=Christiangramia portivictoriae TaxID=326069 RepID=UPI00040A7D19|nr:hypothetical protein [Christiangramia portivictoriae]
MGQDIRKMFQENPEQEVDKLQPGHQQRFEDRLNKAMPMKKKTNRFYFLKIAAGLVIALAVGAFLYFSNNEAETANSPQLVETPSEEKAESKETPETDYRLSDVSPEFKKIEDYYMASLNIQLAKLDMTPGNKELIDAFMRKLETLNDEYIALNAEIQETGLNEETVEAMIANLQLRLDLLKKLKNKLNEIEQSKDLKNENYQA